LLGVFSCSVSGLFGAKAAIRAKEERDQQRAVQRAELQKALDELKKRSVETEHMENERTGRVEE
jgi:hypothetical protein